MKSKTKERLLHDNIKYCRQIGIPLNRIPRIVWTAKEMNQIYEEKHPRSIGQQRAVTSRVIGHCDRELQTIFIDANEQYIRRKYPMRRKGWYRLVQKKWNYYEARHTLVHELVHYRWPKLRHGRAFEKRIKEIIQGRAFPIAD